MHLIIEFGVQRAADVYPKSSVSIGKFVDEDLSFTTPSHYCSLGCYSDRVLFTRINAIRQAAIKSVEKPSFGR